MLNPAEQCNAPLCTKIALGQGESVSRTPKPAALVWIHNSADRRCAHPEMDGHEVDVGAGMVGHEVLQSGRVGVGT